MKIYRAKVSYELVKEGEEEPLIVSSDFAEYVRDMIEENPLQEQSFVITLNPELYPIARHFIGLGPMEDHLIHVREFFRACIMDNAFCYTHVHSHPMCPRAEPSDGDVQCTHMLVHAGIFMRIPLYDSVIVTSPRANGSMHAYSFREHGWPGVKDLWGRQYFTGPQTHHKTEMSGRRAPDVTRLPRHVARGLGILRDRGEDPLIREDRS